MCAPHLCKPLRWPGEGLSQTCRILHAMLCARDQAAMSGEQVGRLMGATWALVAEASLILQQQLGRTQRIL